MNRVIEGGHEPRRFATDMLDRFRDLIVLASVPDAISTGLLDVPPDRAEALRGQAERYGLASLTRAADIVAAGLDQMRGATSPRLLLELMCAQVLLPAAATDERSLLARLERLEAGAATVGAGTAPAPACRPPRRSQVTRHPERVRPAPQPAAVCPGARRGQAEPGPARSDAQQQPGRGTAGQASSGAGTPPAPGRHAAAGAAAGGRQRQPDSRSAGAAAASAPAPPRRSARAPAVHACPGRPGTAAAPPAPRAAR